MEANCSSSASETSRRIECASLSFRAIQNTCWLRHRLQRTLTIQSCSWRAATRTCSWSKPRRQMLHRKVLTSCLSLRCWPAEYSAILRVRTPLPLVALAALEELVDEVPVHL